MSVCTNVDQLLIVGQVLVWRAGLAHYRESALASADRLPPALAIAAVGGSPDASWSALRAAFANDIWFVPNSEEQQAPRVAHILGGFRGLGGPFLELPSVASGPHGLIASSGGAKWLITTDAFGATLHRAFPEETQALTTAKRFRAPALPVAGELTSAAVSARGDVALCTTRLSYCVVVIAYPG